MVVPWLNGFVAKGRDHRLMLLQSRKTSSTNKAAKTVTVYVRREEDEQEPTGRA